MGRILLKTNFLFIFSLIMLNFWENVEGTISVINEETGNVERIIEDRNIRSMSDALEGYVIIANPPNVCELPDPPPSEDFGNENEITTTTPTAPYYGEYLEGQIQEEEIPKKKWILLGVIFDCDLTTKARNAQQSGYSGLIVQNIGTNNSNLIPWHVMRFPLARINHVVVGEYDGALLRYNYSYPANGYYIKFEEDHLYQILCYVLAGIILLLLSTMFLLFWFQICCTIIALRLPYRLGQRFHFWLNPGKRRLTRPMLQLLPVKNWSQSDPFQACAICQEDFMEDEKVRVLPCVHGFHSVCIDPWLLKRSRKCPNCMRWVKLPNEPDFVDDDEDSDDIYSALNLQTSTRSNRARRCSQTQTEVTFAENPNNETNAPLIDLPFPKNIIVRETSFLPNDEAVSIPEIMVTSFTLEGNSTSASAPTTTARDKQVKRFLQNFSYNLTPTPSHHSYSKAVSNPRTLNFPQLLPHSKSLPSEIKATTPESYRDIPKQEETLLETCVDFPSHSYQKHTSSSSRAADVAEAGDVSEELQSISVRPREYSNPGYISVDDEEDYDDATEEQDISSSFDATTISESLPRDDVSIQTTTSMSIMKDDNDKGDVGEGDNEGGRDSDDSDPSEIESFLSEFIPEGMMRDVDRETEQQPVLPPAPMHCLMTVAVAVGGGVDVTVGPGPVAVGSVVHSV